MRDFAHGDGVEACGSEEDGLGDAGAGLLEVRAEGDEGIAPSAVHEGGPEAGGGGVVDEGAIPLEGGEEDTAADGEDETHPEDNAGLEDDVAASTEIAPPEAVAEDVGEDEEADAAGGDEQGDDNHVGRIATHVQEIVGMEGDAGVAEGGDGVEDGEPDGFAQFVAVGEIVSEEEEDGAGNLEGEDVAESLGEEAGGAAARAEADGDLTFAAEWNAAEQDGDDKRAEGDQADAAELDAA